MAALADPAKLGSALHAYARASLDSAGGLWGMVEGGEVVSHEPGTRPVIILPVHGNGQHVRVGNGNGSGSHRARGVAAWRHRHIERQGSAQSAGSRPAAD